MALNVQVTPGKQFSTTEKLEAATLNLLGRPTITMTGTVESANVADAAVTKAKLSQDVYPMGYAAGAGTANAQTFTLSPAITSYVSGQLFTYRPTVANTAAATLAVNGLAAKPIVKDVWGTGLTAFAQLASGDLRIGRPVLVVYLAEIVNGTGGFVLLNDTAARSVLYGVTTGGANVYILTPSPKVEALTELYGRVILFNAHQTNTSACKLQIDGTAATDLKVDDRDPLAGEIVANQVVMCIYYGSYFQIVNPYRTRVTISLLFSDLTAGVKASLPHYLPRCPRFMSVWLECVVTEFGYDVGDRVLLASEYITGVSQKYFFAANKDYVLVKFQSGPQILSALDGTGVTINASKWNLVIEVSL